MSKWQPIETAPKDGTVILLAYRFWPHRYVSAGCWMPDCGAWDLPYPWIVFDPTTRDKINGWPKDGPDAWQPLPAPPQEDEE